MSCKLAGNWKHLLDGLVALTMFGTLQWGKGQIMGPKS